MELKIEAAAAYMAECHCGVRTPAERAACLANKCACHTQTEELLRRAGVLDRIDLRDAFGFVGDVSPEAAAEIRRRNRGGTQFD